MQCLRLVRCGQKKTNDISSYDSYRTGKSSEWQLTSARSRTSSRDAELLLTKDDIGSTHAKRDAFSGGDSYKETSATRNSYNKRLNGRESHFSASGAGSSKESTKQPEIQSVTPYFCSKFQCAVMLADISGFTKLSAFFCQNGAGGLDRLYQTANVLLRRLVQTVYSYKGDGKFVFYFLCELTDNGYCGRLTVIVSKVMMRI